jgi:hypothetical protein
MHIWIIKEKWKKKNLTVSPYKSDKRRWKHKETLLTRGLVTRTLTLKTSKSRNSAQHKLTTSPGLHVPYNLLFATTLSPAIQKHSHTPSQYRSCDLHPIYSPGQGLLPGYPVSIAKLMKKSCQFSFNKFANAWQSSKWMLNMGGTITAFYLPYDWYWEPKDISKEFSLRKPT